MSPRKHPGPAPIAVALAISLACCTPASQIRFNDQFDIYQGLPVSEMTLRLGAPTRAFPTADGRMAFMWDYLGRGKDCLIVVYATTNKPNPTLADWTMRSWQHAGNACM